MPLRFLHAADLHLGARITRFDEATCGRIGEARFHALQQLRERAAELNVDFILIAGDLFDDHSVSRLEAERAFAMLESSRHACPVYIIPGNHDPLIPGGVWDRDPWLREQPHLRVNFLREPEPLRLTDHNVTLFPCPLKTRRSLDDPTAWMAKHPRVADERGYRIGLAHGSLNLMTLPEDDHLIDRDAAHKYGLDYLALGHWHKHFPHPARDGAVRTAYSGTHEPMRFPGGDARRSTGWSSFSADGDNERFHDDGNGRALLVTIDAPGAPPRIEPQDIGRQRWVAEDREVTGQSLGDLLKEYTSQENPTVRFCD